MPEINIQKAEISDTQEIQDFIYDAWTEFFTPPSQEETMKSRPDLQNPEKFYTENNGEFFIARNSKNKIFATIAVHQITYKGGNSGFLRRFMIHKNNRSQGIGAKLLQFLENFCKNKQLDYLMFGVDKSMERNKNFYYRNGYEEFTENIPQELLDDNDTWYLRKKLL